MFAFQESLLGENRSILVQVPNELSSEAINLYTKENRGYKMPSTIHIRIRHYL